MPASFISCLSCMGGEKKCFVVSAQTLSRKGGDIAWAYSAAEKHGKLNSPTSRTRMRSIFDYVKYTEENRTLFRRLMYHCLSKSASH